jgi:hypothetical protein
MLQTIKIIKIKHQHQHHDFFFSVDGNFSLLNHELLLAQDQKFIHKLSPQYGHCITLLSSALPHFGQSL